jgi:hypothetical protein
MLDPLIPRHLGRHRPQILFQQSAAAFIQLLEPQMKDPDPENRKIRGQRGQGLPFDTKKHLIFNLSTVALA